MLVSVALFFLLGETTDTFNDEFGLVCKFDIEFKLFNEVFEFKLVSAGEELTDRCDVTAGGAFLPGHASFAYFFFENLSASCC